jgi:hypothetical protein
VEGNRVGGKGIDRQHVEPAGGLLGQLQPRVAHHHPDVGLALRDEREDRRVGRDLDHQRVDLEHRPVLGRRRIAGEAARSEAHDPDARARTEQAGGRLHGKAHPAAGRIIGERHPRLRRIERLGAVQRGAVEQAPRLRAVRILDGVDAEEAALAGLVDGGDVDLLPAAQRQHQVGEDEGEHQWPADGEAGEQAHEGNRGDLDGRCVDQAERRPEPPSEREDERRDQDAQAPRDGPPALPQLPDPAGERPCRHQQRGRQQQDRMFIDPVEDLRRNQRREQAAKHAAHRHQQVEFGKPCGCRAVGRKRAVKSRRHDQQQHQRGKAIDGRRLPHGQQPRRTEAQQRKRSEEDGDPGDARACAGEDQDKAEEIGRERQHPQKRHRHDVGGDVGGRAEH